MKKMTLSVTLVGGLAVMLAWCDAPRAQTQDDIINQLLNSTPSAAPAPAPADDAPLYRQFDYLPESNEIIDALLPSPGLARNISEIPESQRRTAGLSIPFDYNSDRINADARRWLDKIGPALNSQQLASYRFALVGHTDSTGSASYNRDLSYRRALSVRQYLNNQWGIPGGRLQAFGRGESSPRHSPPTDGRNRRVEVAVSGTY